MGNASTEAETGPSARVAMAYSIFDGREYIQLLRLWKIDHSCDRPPTACDADQFEGCFMGRDLLQRLTSKFDENVASSKVI